MRYRLATFRTTPRAHGDRKIPTNFLPSTAGHGRIRLMRKILLKKDLEDLSNFAAELFVQIANESVADHGSFSISLSGGSTPRTLYALLASEFRSLIDWKKASIFIGDERNVPPDSTESNFRMLRETFVDPLGISHSRVDRWRTESSQIEKIAAEYEFELKQHFAAAGPRFDLVLLGLGSDGHTASLFPHSAALREIEKLAVPNWIEKFQTYRLTTTFPLINNAANVIVMASGGEKARA